MAFIYPWPIGITIRDARPADWPHVAEMLVALAAHVRPGLQPKVTAASLAEHGPDGLKQFHCLVAERAGAVIGVSLYSWLYSGWRAAPGVFISDLFVEEGERSSGLGRGLVQATIEREIPNGCGFVKLDVARDNVRAVAFYERLGFVKEEQDFELVLEANKFAGFTDPD